MANFNLVIDTSNFKPFTYDEIAKPLLLYKQEEEARQQAYLDLQEKAATLEELAASEKDAKSYQAYKDYKSRIQQMVDSMNKYGLNNYNAQVFNLRNSYMKDIKPLNDLLKKRNDLMDEQRANNKDGNNLYSIDYGNTSLEDMKKMATRTYNTVNLNTVRAMSAETFAPIAKQILNDSQYSSILNSEYFQRKIQHGYTLDQMIEELKGTEPGSKLAQVKKAFMDGLGLDEKGFSKDKQKQIEAMVNMGAMQAIGQSSYETLNDQSYLNAAQRASMNATKAEAKRAQKEFEFKYKIENGDIVDYNDKYLTGRTSGKNDDISEDIIVDVDGNQYKVYPKGSSWIVKDVKTGTIVEAESKLARQARIKAKGDGIVSTSPDFHDKEKEKELRKAELAEQEQEEQEQEKSGKTPKEERKYW